MKRTKIEKTSGFLLESGDFCQTLEEAEQKVDEIDFFNEIQDKIGITEQEIEVIKINFPIIRSIFKEMWK